MCIFCNPCPPPPKKKMYMLTQKNNMRSKRKRSKRKRSTRKRSRRNRTFRGNSFWDQMLPKLFNHPEKWINLHELTLTDEDFNSVYTYFRNLPESVYIFNNNRVNVMKMGRAVTHVGGVPVGNSMNSYNDEFRIKFVLFLLKNTQKSSTTIHFPIGGLTCSLTLNDGKCDLVMEDTEENRKNQTHLFRDKDLKTKELSTLYDLISGEIVEFQE